MTEIPKTEYIDPSELKTDGSNPNAMTKPQLKRLELSIQKYGFIVPIVTNHDLLVADGEQRLTIALKLKLKKVPVIRLPVEDVDRRMLRQILNKLKGQHDILKDALEFDLMLTENANKGDMLQILDMSAKDLQLHLELLKECPSNIVNTGTDSQHHWRYTPSHGNDVLIGFGEYCEWVNLELIEPVQAYLKKLESEGKSRKEIFETICRKIISGEVL